MATPPNDALSACKLCGVPSELRVSHIVPRWTYKRVIQTGSGDPNPIMIHDDVARRGGRQLAEPMLCGSCEQRISTWENYLAQIAVQSDDTFPALAQAQRVLSMGTAEIAVFDVSSLDVAIIERFAVSVIWRASASETLFENVYLGDRYHAELGAFLLDDSATLPSYARLMVELLDAQRSTPRLDRVVLPPHSGNRQGYFVHRFSLFGIVFNLIVGRLRPALFDLFSLVTTKRVLVSDGTQQIGAAISEQMLRVMANGGLRRRRR